MTALLSALLRRPALVPLAVCALLLLPLAFRGWTSSRPKPGAPRVLSGDEPHYQLLIHSLLCDGDLDLANNYAASRQGGMDAGFVHSQRAILDDHAHFLLDGRPLPWSRVYQYPVPFEQWRPDEQGRVVPPTLPGAPAIPAGTPEYSFHQPGVAFLLAPLLYPFRHTGYLESAALACSALAVIGAFGFFRLLLRGYTDCPWTVNVVSAAAFLTTPVWFYGRSLFMESFLLFFVGGACALALRRRSVLLPGLFLAAAMQLKAYAALFAVPLALDLLLRREWRRLALFGVPLAAGLFGVLLVNKLCQGGWLVGPQMFDRGSFRQGAVGLLFSPTFGLLAFAPAVLLALPFWPRFLRAHPRDGAVLLGGVGLLYLLLANYNGWRGEAYGPRYLVPVLPWLLVPLAVARLQTWRPLAYRAAAVVLLGAALMHGYAAVDFCRFWGRHPARVLFGVG